MGKVRTIDSAPIKIPPELEHLTKEEILALLRSGLRYALKLTKTRLPEAEDLVDKAWDALLTTRRWDPNKGRPLPSWFRGIIKSYALNSFRDAPKEAEQQDEAIEGARRAGLLTASSASPEDEMVARQAAVERAALKKRVLEMLMPRLANLPLSLAVLKGMIANKSNADIARELGVTPKQVSHAEQMIHHHLKQIHKELEGKANVRT